MSIILPIGLFLLSTYILKQISNKTYLDDVSKTNLTTVKGVLYPKTLIDLINIIKKSDSPITIVGQSHSMGAQTILTNGYAVNMKNINHIILNNNNTITVGAGATWDRIIKVINNYGLSPAIIQSYATFSIGGSISANAHGIINDNSIANSIIEIKLLDCNGNIIICNHNHNNKLFSLVIGGYGLFGVIYEVTLKTVINVKLTLQSYSLHINNFTKIYEHILEDNTIQAKLARINMLDFNNIDLYTFHKISNNKIISNISDKPHEMSKFSQLLYKWIFSTKFGMIIKNKLETKKGCPLDITKTTTLNELLYESTQPLNHLYSPLIELNITHILQEYFIPIKYFEPWMLYLKKYFTRQSKKCILLNITIRFVNNDEISYLKYAKHNKMFAFVFYFRLLNTPQGEAKLRKINYELINRALKLTGTFYLPYKIHYTKEQLITAYPEIYNFIKYKYTFDKQSKFNSNWFININKLLQ